MDDEHRAHLNRILANRKKRGASVSRGGSNSRAASSTPQRAVSTQTAAEMVSTATATAPVTSSIGIGTTPSITASPLLYDDRGQASAPTGNKKAASGVGIGVGTESGMHSLSSPDPKGPRRQGEGSQAPQKSTTTTTTTTLLTATSYVANSTRSSSSSLWHVNPPNHPDNNKNDDRQDEERRETGGWGGAATNAKPQTSAPAHRSLTTNRIISPDFSGKQTGTSGRGGGDAGDAINNTTARRDPTHVGGSTTREHAEDYQYDDYEYRYRMAHRNNAKIDYTASNRKSGGTDTTNLGDTAAFHDEDDDDSNKENPYFSSTQSYQQQRPQTSYSSEEAFSSSGGGGGTLGGIGSGNYVYRDQQQSRVVHETRPPLLYSSTSKGASNENPNFVRETGAAWGCEGGGVRGAGGPFSEVVAPPTASSLLFHDHQRMPPPPPRATTRATPPPPTTVAISLIDNATRGISSSRANSVASTAVAPTGVSGGVHVGGRGGSTSSTVIRRGSAPPTPPPPPAGAREGQRRGGVPYDGLTVTPLRRQPLGGGGDGENNQYNYVNNYDQPPATHQAGGVRDARGVPLPPNQQHIRHWVEGGGGGRSHSATEAEFGSPSNPRARGGGGDLQYSPQPRGSLMSDEHHRINEDRGPNHHTADYNSPHPQRRSASAGDFKGQQNQQQQQQQNDNSLFARGVFDNFRKNPILVSSNIRPYRKNNNGEQEAKRRHGEGGGGDKSMMVDLPPPSLPPPRAALTLPNPLGGVNDGGGEGGEQYQQSNGDEMLVGIANQWPAVGGGLVAADGSLAMRGNRDMAGSIPRGARGTQLISSHPSKGGGGSPAAPLPLPPAMAAALVASKAALGPTATAAATLNPTITNLLLPHTDPNPFRAQRFEDFVIDPDYRVPPGHDGAGGGSAGVGPKELIRRFREGGATNTGNGNGGPDGYLTAVGTMASSSSVGVIGGGGGVARTRSAVGGGSSPPRLIPRDTSQSGDRQSLSPFRSAAGGGPLASSSSNSPIRFNNPVGVEPNPHPTEMSGAAPQISALVQHTANAAAPLYNFGAALRALESGDWFLKWSRRGEVSKRYFTVDSFNAQLHWCHHKESKNIFTRSVMKLSDVISFKPVAIVDDEEEGAADDGGGIAAPRTIYKIEITTKKRYLHIGTEIKDKFDVWFDTLKRIIEDVQRSTNEAVHRQLQGQRVSTTKPSDRALLRQMNTREFYGTGDD